MKMTLVRNEGGSSVYTISIDTLVDLEHNRLIWDGVVIPVQIINEDFIRVGRLLIHRSALQEGGWYEYTLGELGFAQSGSIESTS